MDFFMISVIIPAYNEEKYILDTLKSIPRKEVENVEIIVVSDASTDNTISLVKSKVDRVVQLKKRQGPSIAKNEGAKVAKGDILFFLDADTLLEKGILKEIEEKTEKKMVGSCRIKPSSSKFKHRLLWFFKNYFCGIFGIANGCIFIHKETFLKYKGFPDEKGEDGLFVRKIKKEGRFLVLDKYVVSSSRRFERKGYISVWLYWIKEKLKPSEGVYDAVR